ncbi:MAG: response regulator [Oscillibacter sp.]|nr:response regulator [Oscillibacter sp.]
MDWVAIADDDVMSLKAAGHILNQRQMRVSALKSGAALLDFLKANRPDLILLDVKMPGLSGFETFQAMKERTLPGEEIPVIFLTADESQEAEEFGLQLGAMDFIKKPFAPGVLALRVRHTIQLVRLQRNLEAEVERKTRENERLSLHVVQTLAEAIDAKDAYTKGHSGRVASYAREIARRYGYPPERQREIYMIGLLHDVGKIGVPDSVISKPEPLTPEERQMIERHPVLGARILERIREMPNLSIGARWHHEKYGGGGYPDGLQGTEIPEEARIIAVADSYDAMTSRRSYRDVLPQSVVRDEIANGKGTQFDPVFADILLAMMDEDADYQMKERESR